jgi:hypothetical protein
VIPVVYNDPFQKHKQRIEDWGMEVVLIIVLLLKYSIGVLLNSRENWPYCLIPYRYVFNAKELDQVPIILFLVTGKTFPKVVIKTKNKPT